MERKRPPSQCIATCPATIYNTVLAKWWSRWSQWWSPQPHVLQHFTTPDQLNHLGKGSPLPPELIMQFARLSLLPPICWIALCNCILVCCSSAISYFQPYKSYIFWKHFTLASSLHHCDYHHMMINNIPSSLHPLFWQFRLHHPTKQFMNRYISE